jgi:hypothetical protein
MYGMEKVGVGHQSHPPNSKIVVAVPTKKISPCRIWRGSLGLFGRREEASCWWSRVGGSLVVGSIRRWGRAIVEFSFTVPYRAVEG